MTSHRGVSRGEAPIVLSLTACLTVAWLAPLRGIALAAGLMALVLTTFAWRQRMPAASSLGLLFVPYLGLGVAGLGPPQVVFALALAVYGGIVSRVPWLHDAGRWCIAGNTAARFLVAGIVFAALSGVALLAWYHWTQPNLDDLVESFVPSWPLWLLVPGAIVFSVVNATLEEAAFRGVCLDSLDRALGTGITPLLLQATAFAALHFQAGFPRGIAGLGLTFLYGFVMGELRRRSGGLMAPVVAHVITDLVVVTIVLSLVSSV